MALIFILFFFFTLIYSYCIFIDISYSFKYFKIKVIYNDIKMNSVDVKHMNGLNGHNIEMEEDGLSAQELFSKGDGLTYK